MQRRSDSSRFSGSATHSLTPIRIASSRCVESVVRATMTSPLDAAQDLPDLGNALRQTLLAANVDDECVGTGRPFGIRCLESVGNQPTQLENVARSSRTQIVALCTNNADLQQRRYLTKRMVTMNAAAGFDVAPPRGAVGNV